MGGLRSAFAVIANTK